MRIISVLLFLVIPFSITKIGGDFGITNFIPTDKQNIIIPPDFPPFDPPVGSIPDLSTSFNDAVELSLNYSTINEYFQSLDDYDYYVYEAEYTNYCKFYLMGSCESYSYGVSVYKSTNTTTPVMTYNHNTDNVLSDSYSIYIEQDEIYYFVVYEVTGQQYLENPESPDSINIVIPHYVPYIVSANNFEIGEGMTIESYFGTSNPNYTHYYNGGFTRKLFFASSAYTILNNNKTMRDYILEAAAIWNKVGVIQFEETLYENQCDIVFESVFITGEGDKGTGWFFITDSEHQHYQSNRVVGEIDFNLSHINHFSSSLKTIKTALHEMGHSIGLGHYSLGGTSNVMYGSSSYYAGKLGKFDIGLYRYIYG